MRICVGQGIDGMPIYKYVVGDLDIRGTKMTQADDMRIKLELGESRYCFTRGNDKCELTLEPVGKEQKYTFEDGSRITLYVKVLGMDS